MTWLYECWHSFWHGYPVQPQPLAFKLVHNDGFGVECLKGGFFRDMNPETYQWLKQPGWKLETPWGLVPIEIIQHYAEKEQP